MSTVEIDISSFFCREELERMARSTSFVERSSPIDGFKFLLTFTTGLLNTPDGTLAQLAAFLSSACGTKVSAQAVDERINVMAEEFMRLCLAKAISMSRRPLEFEEGILAGFDHVYVIDSTNFELHPSLADVFKGNGGGASKASMRIQLVLDYLKGTIHVKIGDTTLSDPKTLYDIVDMQLLDMSGKCLYLSDLGYFKTATFEKVVAIPGQYFLSKLMFGVKLLDKYGKTLDLQGLLKKSPESFDMTVQIGGLTCRLVGRRLPDNVVNQRLRKANEASERTGGITDAYRLFLQYAMCITNLPVQYGEKALFVLYRIRWRIELVFKTWKSILAMHKIRSSKRERVMCEVYGKLILAALSSMVCAASDACLDGMVVSLHRAMRHMRVAAMSWALAIVAGARRHMRFISCLAHDIARLCTKRSQKKKQTIEHIVGQTFVQDGKRTGKGERENEHPISNSQSPTDEGQK